MKRIAIVEYSVPNHYIALNSVCKIIAGSVPDSSFLLFVSPVVHDLAKELLPPSERIQYYVFDPDVASQFDEFFLRLSSPEFDLIVFTSIYSNIKKLLTLETDAIMVYGVHNEFLKVIGKSFFVLLYSSLFISFTAANKPMRFSRDAFYILRNLFPAQFIELRNKQRFIRKVLRNNGKILFFGPNLYNYSLSYLDAATMLQVPFSIYEDDVTVSAKESTQADGVLRICVPGTINERLRDYKRLLEVLLENVDSLRDKVEIVLLGKLVTEELLEQIVRLERSGVSITYFKELIPESEFSRQVKRCDFILGNLKTSNVPYGKIAETGVLFSMIRFSKPGIFSESFSVFPELESSVVRFTDYSQLPSVLLTLSQNKQLCTELSIQAGNNARKFSPEHYADVFAPLLRNHPRTTSLS